MTSTSIYQEPVLSYVYRLDHPTTGEFYFGYRKANIVPASQDLGIEYFTSSKYVEPRFHEFDYSIIQEFNDPFEAYDLEQFLIYQERKNPLILNRRCHYGSKSQFTMSNKKHSQETRDKMSAAQKGVPKPPRSEEQNAANSARQKGVPKSLEHKAKISAATKGVPKPTRTEEHNAKVSAALTGVPKSLEHNAKVSAALTGVPKPKFFSIIETRKTYDIQKLSRWYPEFKQYY